MNQETLGSRSGNKGQLRVWALLPARPGTLHHLQHQTLYTTCNATDSTPTILLQWCLLLQFSTVPVILWEVFKKLNAWISETSGTKIYLYSIPLPTSEIPLDTRPNLWPQSRLCTIGSSWPHSSQFLVCYGIFLQECDVSLSPKAPESELTFLRRDAFLSWRIHGSSPPQ